MHSKMNGEPDELYVREALALAQRGMGWCSPNPPVGAVVVDQAGHIVGRGWHQKAGGAHAEVAAIQNAGGEQAVKGMSLYVTLEPCSTHGKTPPCVDLILRSGIRRVVIGCDDPNPIHRGRGVHLLRQAGIEVKVGVLRQDCLKLIRGFTKRITTGRPWVVLKAAVSLDGRLTRPGGEGRWLTGPLARADAHELRGAMDAILVGAGTLLADDPILTVRVPQGHSSHGRRILRVVLSGQRKLPESAQLFHSPEGGEVLVLHHHKPGEVLDELGRRGVNMLLIEGGTRVFESFLGEGLCDEAVVYVAPVLCGGSCLPFLGKPLTPGSITLHHVETKLLGSDSRITGTFRPFSG